ncbi:MAG: hypothetical protein IT580_10835 [Verrucomicrobiales bacterium]|nr:hypothetical protein [Verrucomicrobiales bacterium]
MAFAVAILGLFSAQAQVSTVLFQDDFSSNTIDPAKYQPDAPFFEGGVGDIHAEAKDGAIEFVGTTTTQWWAGGTLRVVPTFNATESTPVTVSVDRVSELGQGTASRSALWILDETKTKYVLFADVRAEGGWRYNRKIGEDGDAPTGSGNDITAFNGETFDDGGLHRMSIVADGKTVKLMLDGQVGTEVKFPFSKIVVQFGAYARANNDTAATRWDNLKIETQKVLSTVFSDDFSSNTIDPAKYQPDAPFFEGGVGDIHAEARDGTIEFVGTTTTQWWAGGTLRVVPTFTATESTPVVVSIDRVSELGQGTASRSALWILDESKTKYVLFADVRAEGGWRYNRKIGEDGDAPTGSGNDIAVFNGGTFDDGGLHRMSIVADGKTVKLMLDGQLGTEVKFPFSKVVVEFGAYARANNDTAATTWDNLKIETILPDKLPPVFQDDFASNTIDPAKYKPSAPFFEGGVGDIHAEAKNGTIEFVGTTTQQWWAGATLQIQQTFPASEQETITLGIDRVSELGQGTASRSALWILDETRTRYVLFADVRGEGGWRYNRKIGEDGDVPTGGGTDIVAFNGGTFDDGALHRMGIVADGKTVKLSLDGVQGAEVKFPFSPVIFEFGSYARANNDTAATTWDNLVIESTGSAAFTPTSTTVREGQFGGVMTVRIPAALNASRAIQLNVVSSDATVAVPEGGTGGTLSVTFPAGGANTASFRVRGLKVGTAKFAIEGSVPAANQLTVAVTKGPVVLLEDAFAGGTLDASKWEVSNRSFEAGTGAYTVTQTGGALEISGATDADFWAGAGVASKAGFVATKELNLVVEVDRVMLENQGGTAARAGVYLTTADYTKYVFFSQNLGESGFGWAVNANPGSPTGNGSAVGGFGGMLDGGDLRKIRLVADGSTVEVFLNGVSGGKVEFPVNSDIRVVLAAYGRAAGDTALARFDNLKVENALPCVAVTPAAVSMTVADTGRQLVVSVPTLLHDEGTATVTVTSRNPAVAIPEGAASGVLTLTFAPGTPDTQAVAIKAVGVGSTTFEVSSTPAACVSGSVAVEVVEVPKVLVVDDFSGTTIDAAKWVRDDTSFDTGTLTAESGVVVANGVVKFSVTAEVSLWPGIALFTSRTFDASASTPVTFEIDRSLVEFVLTTGTGAEQRTGIWVKEPTGNFVFLNDYIAHDGRNYGWRYNKRTGQDNDNPTNEGLNIPAFDGGNFDNRGQHRLKMVANGTKVSLYVDGVFGVDVPFPYAQGLSFGFGTYVDETANVAMGTFDNARILGEKDTVSRLTATAQGGNLVITWTGSGTLQSAAALGSPTTWVDVTPAPAGNTYTTTTATASRFFRVRQ